MAGNKEGAEKLSAANAGVSVAEHRRRCKRGRKFCIGCREWHAESAFGRDASRGDGFAPTCREFRNRRQRARYTPTVRPSKGRSFVPARDGDKKQARRRVNYFVEAGLLPPPNDLACTDCGHEWKSGERRHEYDHHLGYAAEHHESVEAVCTTCHHMREEERV